MKNFSHKHIEKIFRESTSPDDLFDAFNIAVKNKICDVDLYKILLANPGLSKDELIMFTEKLVREFKDYSYDLYLWTARIFENYYDYYKYLDSSIYYYQKAANIKPTEYHPLLSAINLYNYEIDIPANESILNLINTGVSKVNRKSKIYFALAKHFNKKGDIEQKQKYFRLAENAAHNENQK